MSLPLADTRRDPGPASRNFTVRTLGALSASVIALPLMATGAQAAIPTPKPTRALPNALDAAPPYQKGTRCLSSAQPGPVAFAKLLNETYGKHVYGILRTCAAEHGEGRALDWMLNANDSTSLALGNALTRWLAAPDSQGRQGAMARRFGINYIIWNRQMWRAYDPSRGWAPYYGVSPHTDHIHFSFTWDGAYARNSWWTGTAVTNYLTGPLSSPPPAPAVMTASGYPLLKQGATGADVALAQKVIGTTADGSFGPLTATALAAWQKSNGVSVTKELDNATWTKMVSLGAVPSRTATTSTDSLEKYAGTTLKLWSKGEAVKALQKAIGNLAVDGSYGPLTEARVKEYQKSKGLAVTGVTDAKVWDALMGKTTATPPATTTDSLEKYAGTTLRRGSKGDAVKALQKAVGKLTVDGSYGPGTEARVKEYQKSKGLAVTGVTDAKVWDALMGGGSSSGGTSTTPTVTSSTATEFTAHKATTLRVGSSGAAVKALQRGLGGIVVDGAFGSRTLEAVRAFQTSAKLSVTGVVDGKTWDALELRVHPLHPYWGTVLKRGSSGAAVVALQKALRTTADGAFGPKTEAAVKTAQQAAKLTQTGVVGTVTWKAVEARMTR
ncbi:MAG: peptidoglycan-binding protein [Ornithinibacter sp.]